MKCYANTGGRQGNFTAILWFSILSTTLNNYKKFRMLLWYPKKHKSCWEMTLLPQWLDWITIKKKLIKKNCWCLSFAFWFFSGRRLGSRIFKWIRPQTYGHNVQYAPFLLLVTNHAYLNFQNKVLFVIIPLAFSVLLPMLVT